MKKILIEIDDLIAEAYTQLAVWKCIPRNALIRDALYQALYDELRTGLPISPSPKCPKYLESFEGMQRHGRAREWKGKIVPVDVHGLVMREGEDPTPVIGSHLDEVAPPEEE